MRAGAAEEPIHKFAFGGGHSLPGEIQVTPANFYSEAAGYGFEPGAEVTAANGCITSTKAFYFSTKLPEGNYRVTVTFGDKSGDYTTTVKAELRRLMLEHIHTDSSQRVTRSFVVNLRGTRIGNEGEVRLKEREKTTEWWDWDDKLTLEFNDARPCVAAIEITQVEVPTLFILGDSTVCDQPTEPWNSWGQMLPRFFKPEIAVANHAESGETIAGALSAHRFGKVFSLMKAGDYLFVQFGHNDMKDKQPDAPQKYKARLRQVIAQTRACGGTPVVVTSMERKNGISHPTLAGYPAAAREIATQEKCALIDLNTTSVVFYQALGTNLGRAFQDGTHHNNYGSYELAKCVVEGIRQSQLPLAKFIVDDFDGFDPAHPDPVETFRMPASPRHSDVKPLGN